MSARSEGIPLERDVSSQLLPWLLAIMVYLVSLALFSAFAMHKVAGQWDIAHSAHLTIQLPPPAFEDLSEAAKGQSEKRKREIEEILNFLERYEGIDSAHPIEPLEQARLLEPWLDDPEAAMDLPLPDLIAITVEQDKSVDAAQLGGALRKIVKDILVTDHKPGLEGLFDLAVWLRLVSLSVIVLVAMASILMAILITRMGLAAHAGIIELLHLMGAQDHFVAKQFERHGLSGGLIGGLVGLAFALATFAAIDQVTREVDHQLVPDTSLSGLQWAFFFLLPLICAAITTLTVRITVLRSLARLP